MFFSITFWMLALLLTNLSPDDPFAGYFVLKRFYNKLWISPCTDLWISCGHFWGAQLSTFDTQATHGLWRRCHEPFEGAKLLGSGVKSGLSTGFDGPNSNNNKIYI